MASDLLLFLRGDNLDFVGSETEERETVGDGGTNVVAMLTNAAGEDEQIDATEKSCVGADNFADGSGEDVERQDGGRVVGMSAFFESFDIALAIRKAEEAAAVIDEFLDGVGGEIFRT